MPRVPAPKPQSQTRWGLGLWRRGLRHGRRIGLITALLAGSIFGPLSGAALASGTSAAMSVLGQEAGLGVNGPNFASFGVLGVGTSGQFGVNSIQDLSTGTSSLLSVDPLNGQLMLGTAANPISNSLSTETDLMQQGMLAINMQQLAAQAQAQQQAQKAQAQQQGQTVATGTAPNQGIPAAWQLAHFTACGSPGNTAYQDRIAVVDAFTTLCQAAAAAHVQLTITGAFRTPAQQAQLFQQAVSAYGSVAQASKWVAAPSANGLCTSQHCAGDAVDVSQAGAAGTWLHAVIGCEQNGTVSLGQTSCPQPATAVVRSQLYGFVFPIPWNASDMQLGLPTSVTGGSTAANCNPPPDLAIPSMIAQIFRCRLTQAGITGPQQVQIVAQALVVTKCESSWNPNALAFNGAYRYQPDPATGLRYSAAGIFQFIDTSANAWVPGGYAAVLNPVANIQGGASYFLSGYRSNPATAWDPWACAGVNDGFQKKSVLPGYPYGPAALPAWAYQY